ncbi:MAG: GPR endopeptidase [Clostridia bacterium]|nr:GPR endopeptidase [Clostridia bacterium]
MFNFRTDLAVERRDVYKKANNLENEIDGIESEKEEIDKNLKIERVFITNENGEKAVGKPKGTYVTIDIKNLKIARDEEIQKASDVLTSELSKILDKHVTRKEEMLVVGLGNVYATPDSLGPKVINEIDVTRHLIKYLPQYVDENTRNVCAIAPGVLGTTGMETLEILKGIVENVKPKVIVVIDSLASRSIERISSSLQISDTGIVPGAGVGNARAELSQSTLGIPVIALGIPTVVELATLVSDGIDIFIKILQEKAQSNEYLNNLQQNDKYEEVKEALNIGDYNMIVTPKEIDDLIENMKDVVARGINQTIS